MKLIIARSPMFTNAQLLCQVLAPERHRITEALHGNARGADQLGCMQQLGKPVMVVRFDTTA